MTAPDSSTHTPRRSTVFPVTLPAFQAMFGTEAACRAYLFTARWPGGFVCPKCETRRAWQTKTRGEVLCENGHRTSVTAGTVLHRTKQPLASWFYGAWLMVLEPEITIKELQRRLGVNHYPAAHALITKIKRARLEGNDPLAIWMSQAAVDEHEAAFEGPTKRRKL